jgi:DNA-binding NarL/FixJ family response regulator
MPSRQCLRKTTPSIRVALADSHCVLVEALTDRLNREPGFVVVGTAGTAAELLDLPGGARPDVILSELHFEDAGALDVAPRLARRGNARLVLLTGTLADVFVRQAARLAIGYLLKTEPAAAVVAAIRQAAAGEVPLSTAVAARLRTDPVTGCRVLRSDSPLAGLTARQIEVLRHLAQGRSVRKVAEILRLTEKGVESHKYRIMNRLGVRNRVGLVRCAIREGMLPP